MSPHENDRARRDYMRRCALAMAAAWTLVVLAVTTWAVYEHRRSPIAAALVQARSAFKKDIAYRRWASERGGVYVPITETTPPNPYLSHLPERDLVTADGRRLTLINPAYMTRQVQELGQADYGLSGHITSLNPLRPENAPDKWEAEALRTFERGEAEVFSVETFKGAPHLRMMRPFMVEASCLKCHGHQGYAVGDVRGGVSVSVPIEPMLAASRGSIEVFGFGAGLIWLLGVLGIWLATRKLQARIAERDRAEDELRRHRDQLAKLVEDQTGEIRQSCDMLKTVLDGLGAVVAVFDAETHAHLYLNQTRCKLLENTADDECWKALEGERPRRDEATADEQGDAEGRLITRNVREVRHARSGAWWELHEHDVEWIDGRVARLVLAADITERKRIEQAFYESEKRYHELFNSMNSGAAVYRVADDGADFVFTDFNPAAQIMEGVTKEEVIGRRVTEAFPGVEKFGLLEVFRRVWKTGQAEQFPVSVYQDDRLEGWRDNRVYKLPSGEIVAVYTDETERKRTEKELTEYRSHLEELVEQRSRELEESRGLLHRAERLASLGTLAAGIAHEINNPLGLIMLGAQETLRNSDDQAVVEKFMTRIKEDVKRCASIVKGILRFARDETAEAGPVDVDKVLHNAVEFTGEYAKRHGISVSVDCPQNIPPVIGAAGELEQVVVNLIHNAVQAGGAGQTVEIRVVQTPESVRLLIVDHGRGMSTEAARRAFDPFFTTRQNEGGIGLGLSICHGIVADMHGGIGIESVPGKGTTITVELPAYQSVPVEA